VNLRCCAHALQFTVFGVTLQTCYHFGGMNFRANPTFRAGSWSALQSLIVPKVIAAVTNGAQAVLEISQQYVPYRTGALAASGGVEVEWSGNQITASVSYTSEHAAYNEFGTGKRGAESGHGGPGIEYDPNWPGMSGSPYLRPGLDGARPAILAAFTDAGFTA
jgi:hypothetical protein